MTDLVIFDAKVRLTLTVEVNLDVCYDGQTTVEELHRDASERAIEGVTAAIGGRGLNGKVIDKPSVHLVSAPVL